jgi:hypothetical protein
MAMHDSKNSSGLPHVSLSVVLASSIAIGDT